MNKLALYEIDEQIEEVLSYIINEETGELNPIAEAELEALKKDREIKISNCGLFVKNMVALIDALQEEERKLRERRQSAEKRIDWVKKYLSHYLDGEKVDLPNLRIGWRKSKSIEITPEFNLSIFAEKNPTYVKKIYAIRKKELKELMESTGVSFDGIELVEKNNIQIK